MKNKILYIFSIILFAMLLMVATNVNAAEYKSKDQGLILTMNDLGIGGTTKSIETRWEENEYKTEDYNYDYIYNTITIENVKQATLNEYAKTPRTFKANIKIKLPSNDINKVVFSEIDYSETEGDHFEKDIDKKYKIETINGNKYLVYDTNLYYENVSAEEPIDNNIKNIFVHEGKLNKEGFIKIYKSNGSYQKYSLDTNINIVSENKPFDYSYGYINKYGQLYPVGGSGGGDFEDKWYLTAKLDIEGFGFGDIYWLPTDTKLSEAYCAVYIDVYQGNKMEIEGMGTLNYAGISRTALFGEEGYYYVYKNSLDNLKKLTKTVTFKAKTESGYTLTRGITNGWTFYEGSKEEQVKVENTDLTLNMLRYDGDFKLGTTKAKKTDILYKKTENKDEIYESSEVYMNIDDLCILSGTYQGNINITFDVGTQYNGKKYKLYYDKGCGKSDYYTGTINNGKVTITINASDIKRADDNMLKPGDISGDGKINTKDAREVLLAYIGKTKLTDGQKIIADVNKDGKINTKDARQILLYYIGKIKKF